MAEPFVHYFNDRTTQLYRDPEDSVPTLTFRKYQEENKESKIIFQVPGGPLLEIPFDIAQEFGQAIIDLAKE